MSHILSDDSRSAKHALDETKSHVAALLGAPLPAIWYGTRSTTKTQNEDVVTTLHVDELHELAVATLEAVAPRPVVEAAKLTGRMTREIVGETVDEHMRQLNALLWLEFANLDAGTPAPIDSMPQAAAVLGALLGRYATHLWHYKDDDDGRIKTGVWHPWIDSIVDGTDAPLGGDRRIKSATRHRIKKTKYIHSGRAERGQSRYSATYTEPGIQPTWHARVVVSPKGAPWDWRIVDAEPRVTPVRRRKLGALSGKPYERTQFEYVDNDLASHPALERDCEPSSRTAPAPDSGDVESSATVDTLRFGLVDHAERTHGPCYVFDVAAWTRGERIVAKTIPGAPLPAGKLLPKSLKA